ncbi:Plasmid stabilization system [Desulfamplus magnetovallimortis]|uniref:Plasmid stabilization system n=1 Tax=Desulfamplus magnetovallimortis TaxID=1246637 RepID=A0A1W1HG80_9BACT|nr:Plasmid stabilization system [Desulfamplus magnetovallimortis]
MRTITWHNKARKQIKKIPRQYQNGLYNHIDMLKEFPVFKGLDIIPLTNHKYDYRMRVGRYRVLFNDDEQIQIGMSTK